MRPLKRSLPVQLEQGDLASLKKAVKEQVEFWQDTKNGNGPMVFGSETLSRQEYAESLSQFLAFLKSDPQNEAIDGYLKEHFRFFEVYGGKKWGEVLVTSYYEPVLEGSTKPTKEKSQPLYSVPSDMVIVNLGEFAEALPSLADLKGKLTEQKSISSILRGRLIPSDEKGVPDTVVPFPNRQQIDDDKVLAKQGIELCYVDPIEAFFFHIQGSGRIDLGGGKSLHLTYAAQNGHPYYAIGRDLLEIIPKEEMSLQGIEAHLRSLPEDQQKALLFRNPSYVFFQEAPNGRGVSYQGTQVVGGRTIATDKELFPKGSLAILETTIPVFASDSDAEPSAWEGHTRLVLDQDTGGAIRGAGRVDYFWGSGKQAARSAGVMKNPGRLIYLVPKKNSALHP
ncbi:MAG: MltA domain-containing protein [Bdellovibrionaceae bacterium]|nr:MltA domain-containing protein [Bdellovibrionales bacterium]MCB9083328.1 MltA domain-containing protein [Pseudobdellovibrionaceae bacterium]